MNYACYYVEKLRTSEPLRDNDLNAQNDRILLEE